MLEPHLKWTQSAPLAQYIFTRKEREKGGGGRERGERESKRGTERVRRIKEGRREDGRQRVRE